MPWNASNVYPLITQMVVARMIINAKIKFAIDKRLSF
jgi:hypothetical protein